MVWRILAFRQNCLETFRATHILSAAKCSPKNAVSGRDKVYADNRGGSLGRGRQMRVFIMVVENGDFRFFRSQLYIGLYAYMTAFTKCECR